MSTKPQPSVRERPWQKLDAEIRPGQVVPLIHPELDYRMGVLVRQPSLYSTRIEAAARAGWGVEPLARGVEKFNPYHRFQLFCDFCQWTSYLSPRDTHKPTTTLRAHQRMSGKCSARHTLKPWMKLWRERLNAHERAAVVAIWPDWWRRFHGADPDMFMAQVRRAERARAEEGTAER